MTRSIVIELACPECGSGLPGGGVCPICRVKAVRVAYTIDDSPTCPCGAVLHGVESLCRQCASRQKRAQAAAAASASLAAQRDWLEAP